MMMMMILGLLVRMVILMTTRVDGTLYSLKSPDVDGDGKVGGVEVLSSGNSDFQPVVQPTELGETLRDFNSDVLDAETRMTSIDMKTRIFNIFERNSLMAVDSLVAMSFLPLRCLTITRQAKRLNVSLRGEGRKEIVEIVAGKRAHDEKSGGFMNNVKGMMGMGGGN